jgi:hypothetical protein
MGGKHSNTDERIRIVAEAMSGQWNKSVVIKRHGISPASFYRWQKQYPRAAEAYALLLAGKTLAYLRLAGEMEQAHEGLANDDGLDPWAKVPLEDVFAMEEAEQADEKPDDIAMEDIPAVGWEAAPRFGRKVAKVHGNLSREDNVTLQISLPKALHHRLTQERDGSLNRTITGLIGYALERLDEQDLMLHVFDGRKPKPEFRRKRLGKLVQGNLIDAG